MPPATPPTKPPPASEWGKLAYELLVIATLPLGFLYLLWRLIIKGSWREGLGERLGFLPKHLQALGQTDDPVVWVHAVSVGEVAAVEPILHELRQAEPHAHLVLSTGTATGHIQAERQPFDVDAVVYFPFDFPGLTERALTALRPDLIVLLETELWPRLLAVAQDRGIPVCVVNGRLSDRSFPRYRLVRFFMRWVLSKVALVCAQSELNRDRFVAIGADPERVRVTGNSKFDESFPQVPAEETAKWRQDLGFTQEQPILLAASTHAREEELLLRCYERLRADSPDLGLLIAPRHPERGDAIEALIGEFGYGCLRRSRGEAAPATGGARVTVALLDTIGELSRVFSIATVVVMGGSFAPVGGHNLLQPMALGKPVVFGPYMHNFRDISDLTLSEGAGLQVSGPEELTATVARLLGSPPERELLAVKARALIERNNGTAHTTVSCLLPLLDTQ